MEDLIRQGAYCRNDAVKLIEFNVFPKKAGNG